MRSHIALLRRGDAMHERSIDEFPISSPVSDTASNAHYRDFALNRLRSADSPTKVLIRCTRGT